MSMLENGFEKFLCFNTCVFVMNFVVVGFVLIMIHNHFDKMLVWFLLFFEMSAKKAIQVFIRKNRLLVLN